MAHDRLPLPLPPPPDEAFDDSEPTAFDRLMIERRMDALSKRIAEAEDGWARQLSAMAFDVREASDSAKRAEAAVTQLAETQDRLIKLILEERAERFALGDRVSNLEQPRQTRRRK